MIAVDLPVGRSCSLDHLDSVCLKSGRREGEERRVRGFQYLKRAAAQPQLIVAAREGEDIRNRQAVGFFVIVKNEGALFSVPVERITFSNKAVRWRTW